MFQLKGVQKDSRFSWTNSQSGKTANDTSRFSVATSASSAPRFRTVESWVGHQASQLDEHQFQQYLEKEIESRVSVMGVQPKTAAGLAGAKSAHAVSRMQPYKTDMRDSNYFMQHPGTKVPLPNGSRIPSAILDTKIGPREL